MRLTSKSEYALLALVYLARHFTEEKPNSVEEVATHQGIPLKFLEQILLTLKRDGFVQSTRGSKGGYKLAKSPSAISLAEVVRSLEGPLAPTTSVSTFFYQATPIEKEPGLCEIFRKLRDTISHTLEHTSLADVAGTQ